VRARTNWYGPAAEDRVVPGRMKINVSVLLMLPNDIRRTETLIIVDFLVNARAAGRGANPQHWSGSVTVLAATARSASVVSGW
jgi:hypothetical protein